MISKCLSILSILILNSCGTKTNSPEVKNSLDIIGTWKLISGITIQGKDTTFKDYTNHQESIKIINGSHFAFIRHDLNKGKDSNSVFVSGAGKFSLKGNCYTEHLEYCNYREWEGNTFDFQLILRNDSLIQTGIEKVESLNVDRKIIETYIKIYK